MSFLRSSLFSMILRAADGAAAGGGADKPFWDGKLDAAKDKDVIDYIGGKKYDGFATAIRAGMNAEKLAKDRNAITLPEKGKELEWDGWEKLGFVKEKEKYNFTQPDPTKLPKGFTVNTALRDAMRDMAYENRIPLQVADAIANKMLARDVEAFNTRVTEAEGAKAQLEKDLKAKWGGDYDRNTIFARRAAATLGEKIGLDMEAMGKLNAAMGDAGLVRLFHELGGMIGEDKLFAGDGGAGGGLPQTESEVRAELARLMADKDWRAAFDNPRDPRNQAHVDQRQRLLDQLAALEKKRAA